MFKHGQFVAQEVAGVAPGTFLVFVMLLNADGEISPILVACVLEHRSGNRPMSERGHRAAFGVGRIVGLWGVFGHD